MSTASSEVAWRLGATAAIAIALVQVSLGLQGALAVGLLERPGSALLPAGVLGLQMLVFAGASAFLLVRRRDDERIVALAAIFALTAATFARRPIEHLISQGIATHLLGWLQGLRADAFLPYFVWRFFGDFPRSIRYRPIDWLGATGQWVALLIGGLLFAANFALAAKNGEVPASFSRFDARTARSVYWLLAYGLIAGALPFAVWKAGFAPASERRRARLFTAAVAFSALPVCMFVVADIALPGFSAWLDGGGAVFMLPIVEAFILLVPITTTYAVVVGRVLPTRVVVRQALAYGFARAALGLAAIAPVLWIVWAAVQLREETLAQVFAGHRLAVASIALLVAGLAIRFQGSARDAIDRAFFRDVYDSRRLLIDITRQSREASDLSEWAKGLADAIDGALHLESVVVLVLDPTSRQLVARAGSCRALPADAEILDRLASTPRPSLIDLDRPDASWHRLPEAERHWLADGGFELVVPLVASDRRIIGLIALGPRRSELAPSRGDRELLAAIAGSVAAILESRVGEGVSRGRPTEVVAPALARECRSCGAIFESGEGCLRCGDPLADAALPLRPLDRFLLERRLGAGGMGVVYRAVDLALERTVALKTLPARSPEDAAALRREARAMAAVESAHLARIYSAETWMGTPVLVTEFMFDGILEDRLGRPLPIDELAPLGRDLANALHTLHRAGLLHRDIKPSNIGFGSDGEVRLIDFGLADFFDAPSRPGKAGDSAAPDLERPRQTQRVAGLFGTPLYLSPEVLDGDPPDVSTDLWALCLVLCELYLGHHPFERHGWRETRRAIARGWTDESGGARRTDETRLDEFFARALSADPRARPTSSQQLRDDWGASITTA